MYKVNEVTIRRHNSVVMTVGPMLLSADALLSDQPRECIEDMYWMILESLCYSVGLANGLTERQMADKVEKIAERFASGEFAKGRLGIPL